MSSSEVGSIGADLVLFGVVGLDRTRGGHGSIGRVRDGRRWRSFLSSQSIGFSDSNGYSVTVTSHRWGDEDVYASLRSWAPMDTYLGTPEGKATLLAMRQEPGHRLEAPEVAWRPVTILVDGVETGFEECDLAAGWWAAVGRVPDAIIVVDSRGVPLSAVRLERTPKYPVPPLPDLAERSAAVTQDLDDRFTRVPFRRVRGTADYWALHAIEVDHITRLAQRHDLSDEDFQAIEAHWLARIERELGPTTERLRFNGMNSINNSRIAHLLRSRNVLYQIWSNTVGPGARCWFGNRYTPIRHYTFRLRWRP